VRRYLGPHNETRKTKNENKRHLIYTTNVYWRFLHALLRLRADRNASPPPEIAQIPTNAPKADSLTPESPF
jgi:hypothetical protein